MVSIVRDMEDILLIQLVFFLNLIIILFIVKKNYLHVLTMQDLCLRPCCTSVFTFH